MLVKESPKYRRLYDSIEKMALEYIESGEVNVLNIINVYDELLVYRRNSFNTYTRDNYHFFMEYLD